MAPVVLIRAAEVEGVIAGKKFGRMHPGRSFAASVNLIQVHLEILVAEMDFHQVEIACGGKALNVVIPPGTTDGGSGRCGVAAGVSRSDRKKKSWRLCSRAGLADEVVDAVGLQPLPGLWITIAR